MGRFIDAIMHGVMVAQLLPFTDVKSEIREPSIPGALEI